MNPNLSQKRIAFGYNRFYSTIELEKNQTAAVKLIFIYYQERKSIGKIKDILEQIGK